MKIQILSLISVLIFVLVGASPALASTLSLSPTSGTFNRNCTFSLDIILDTQGVGTDGTDAYLNFDSTRFTMNSIETANKVYPEYPGSGIDPQNSNRILISGLAAFGKPYTGSGKLATINFTVKEAATTGVTQMTFDFDTNNKGSTTDSNVVQTGTATETLSAVTNGNYTVGSGICSGVSPSPSPSTIPGGTTGSKGGVSDSTPSGTFIPLKTLPEGGTGQVTATIAIVGSILTVLGILGLALL